MLLATAFRVVPAQAGSKTLGKKAAKSFVLRGVRDRRRLGRRRLHPPRGRRGGGCVREPGGLRSSGGPCMRGKGAGLFLDSGAGSVFVSLSAWRWGWLRRKRGCIVKEREALAIISVPGSPQPQSPAPAHHIEKDTALSSLACILHQRVQHELQGARRSSPRHRSTYTCRICVNYVNICDNRTHHTAEQ